MILSHQLQYFHILARELIVGCFYILELHRNRKENSIKLHDFGAQLTSLFIEITISIIEMCDLKNEPSY